MIGGDIVIAIFNWLVFCLFNILIIHYKLYPTSIKVTTNEKRTNKKTISDTVICRFAAYFSGSIPYDGKR